MYYGTGDIAESAGVTRQYVQRLCKEGRLPCMNAKNFKKSKYLFNRGQARTALRQLDEMATAKRRK